jgi:hypothetical protein
MQAHTPSHPALSERGKTNDTMTITCRQHCGNHQGIPIGVAVQSQDDGGANVGRTGDSSSRLEWPSRTTFTPWGCR